MQTHFQHGPQIVERFMSRGPSAAVYPGLWTGCELATLAQTWGGLQARDFSGRNRHGDVVGGEWGYGTYRGGAFRAVDFDGTNDYIEYPGTVLSQPFSFGCWYTTADRTAGNKFLVSLGYNSAGSIMLYQNAETMRLIANAGNPNWQTTGIAMPANNTLMHIWCNLAGGIASFYVNGLFVGSNDASGLAGDWPTTTPVGTWHLGYARPRDLNTSYWAGQIADARIYSRALSPAEIRQLAQHPLSAYETRINRYWMFTSSGVAPAPEWVAIPRYGLAAAGLPKYALPRAGVPVAPGVNTWLYARRQSQIIGGGIA